MAEKTAKYRLEIQQVSLKIRNSGQSVVCLGIVVVITSTYQYSCFSNVLGNE